MNDNKELYNNDDNLLRHISDYTSRMINPDNNSDHTIEVAQLASADLVEILTRLLDLSGRDLGTGSSGVTAAAEHTSAASSPLPTTLVRHRRWAQRALKTYVLEVRHLYHIKELQPPHKRQDLVPWK